MPTANHSRAFSVITALFFAFGFITCLNDILVPHLKALFTLSYAQAALVQFCFFSAYFFASVPSGKIVAKLGYKRGTVLGLLITAAGCSLFYPAAETRSYPLFLFGLFVLATGVTLIQVAVNPYIAILGPTKTASARLNLSQAFNSLGTTLAPMFGAFLILKAAGSVQGPYIGLAVTLIALAITVTVTRLPQIHADEQSAMNVNIWRHRHLVLGAAAIFCYVGAEVAIGSYLINFMGLAEIGGYSAETAGTYVSFYWGAAMVGRFVGAVLLRKRKPSTVLAINAVFAAMLVMAAMSFSGSTALFAILVVGLFNSIMFPTIFTLAIDGLGAQTAQGSGILCMAIVGGAIVPLAQGALADRIGLHHSYILPVLCYFFVGYYGLAGYRSRFKNASERGFSAGLPITENPMS